MPDFLTPSAGGKWNKTTSYYLSFFHIRLETESK